MRIVWLNGMPRSGTSWLSQIFDSHPDVKFKLSPLFSYAFKNYVDENSSSSKWQELFVKLYNYPPDEFMDQILRRDKNEYPIFREKAPVSKYLVIKATRFHNLTRTMLHRVPDLKLVHIVRNPCGAINSWLKAPNEFPEHLNPLQEWKSGRCRKTEKSEYWGFEDWVSVTNLYEELQSDYPNNVRIVSYEDLVDSPVTTTQEMFEFVGMRVDDQTKLFLTQSNARHDDRQYSVFKNKNVRDKWQAQLDQQIVTEIYKAIKNSKLEKYLK